MIRGENEKDFSHARKRNGTKGAIKFRKGTRSTDWELVPQDYEYLNFEHYDVLDCWAVVFNNISPGYSGRTTTINLLCELLFC